MDSPQWFPNRYLKKKDTWPGGDEQRARTLVELYQNPEVDAILCARGGFGAMRILPFVDWEKIKNNPKPLIGFSDATALLLSIVQKTGVPVIHGPTLLSLTDSDQFSRDVFCRTLQGKSSTIPIKKARVIKPGSCRGKLLGGNLATLSHLMGTPYQPNLAGCILFIEDIGEPAYKIDRMLSQMKIAGLFNVLKGVVVGKFIDCENEFYIDDILMDIFMDQDIPIVSGIQAGHGKVNHAFYMGLTMRLDTDLHTMHMN